MKLAINDSKKIKEIKDEFNNLFEFLKVEFFVKKHEVGEASAKKDMIEESKTIGEIRNIHGEGELIITPASLVSEVERQFEDNFGLHVQVFRKQNNVWLETTNTDGWTLAKQNETAKFMSSPTG